MCVVVGLVLRRGPVCVLLFGAPCLPPPSFVLLRVVLRVPAGAVLAALLFFVLPLVAVLWWCPPPPSGGLRGVFFMCLSVFAGFAPPPRLVVASSDVLCRASCRVVLRSVVCFVLCPVLCGLLVSGWVLAPFCSARCCAWSFCGVFGVLCCRALLRSLLVVSFRVVPCLFVALWAVPVSVFWLCGAVPVCLRRCSLCGAPSALRRWLMFCVVACRVCVFAIGAGCPGVDPGGSWCPDSVVCFGVSLGAVLRRVAVHCAVCRCVLVRCVVLFCFVWCCRALCPVLGRCPLSWGPVPSGPVFCLVSPRCVCFSVVCCCVVLFAAVLLAVCLLGCRAVRSLSSSPCAVLLCGPALRWCPSPLCCAPWCCAAVWCCGVLSCCLV